MDLLPSAELEGGLFTNPKQARFFVESHGMRLAARQKKTSETDAQFLDRVDALYAAFDPTAETQEPKNMNWIIGILFAIGAGLIGLALYWIFSPKYNTTEDYRALLPLGAGAVFIVLALAVFGLTLLWRLWNNG